MTRQTIQVANDQQLMQSIVGPTGPAGTAVLTSAGTTIQNASSVGATGHWQDVDGSSSIWRFLERIFVGGAVAQNNNRSAAAQPYPGFMPTNLSGAQWAVRDSQLAVMDTRGCIAISGLSRASDSDGLAGGAAPIGISGFLVNDCAVSRAGWAIYGDVQHQGVVGAASYGLELAVKNKSENVTGNPYGLAGGAIGVWLDAGGDPSYGGASTNPCNAAIIILNHDNTWNTGIIFSATGITGTDGVTGRGDAIKMARGHTIKWCFPDGSTSSTITSTVDIGGRETSMLFDNNSIEYFGQSGTNLFFASHDAAAAVGAVNWVQVGNAPNGSAPFVKARASTDADVDLSLLPVGNGSVRAPLSTPASSAAAGTPGNIKWDANFIYVCTALNTWKRAALTAF